MIGPEVVRRTPEETLEAARGQVDRAEECIVIMTDENGDIIICGSTNVISTRLGLIEMAKTVMLRDIIRGDEK